MQPTPFHIFCNRYQRLLPPRLPPPPPPPNERSVFGRASLTFSARPSSSLPFSSAMARSASALALISTNPNPLGCPVSRSVTMLTRSTAPYCSKRDRTASSVAPKLRFPTKIFFIFLPFDLQIGKSGQVRTRADGPDECEDAKTLQTLQLYHGSGRPLSKIVSGRAKKRPTRWIRAPVTNLECEPDFGSTLGANFEDAAQLLSQGAHQPQAERARGDPIQLPR
jgi:hypothetical protein